ncbi:hypothetical protein ASC98_23225 [Rhizobacter sp. Root1238]|nr:hypothetical protein ASC88_28380 [Rhizobacter sp. Root29]KQW10307.1 hypothetical protein ASC98_23225 [Rhizobacter sp. Root1238]
MTPQVTSSLLGIVDHVKAALLQEIDIPVQRGIRAVPNIFHSGVQPMSSWAVIDLLRQFVQALLHHVKGPAE